MFETIEKGLQALKKQQSSSIASLKLTEPYIELQGTNPIESNNTPKITFDLQQEVYKFLSFDENSKVLLLLGEGGSGKSTLCQSLIQNLWQDYQKEKTIPLLIKLLNIKNLNKIVEEVLGEIGFNENQINILKKERRFIFILDGYNELLQFKNLYVSNHLEQWKAKTIITCRSEFLYFISNYEKYFMPFQQGHGQPSLLQQIFIEPLSFKQVETYLSQQKLSLIKEIEAMPWLKSWIKVPFFLNLIINYLPNIVEQYKKANTQEQSKLFEAACYDLLIEHWFTYQASIFTTNKQEVEKLKIKFWDYAKKLAEQMHKEQIKVINYRPQAKTLLFNTATSPKQNPWISFFDNNFEILRARLAFPLRKMGNNQYSFIDESLLEHFRKQEKYALTNQIAIGNAHNLELNLEKVLNFSNVLHFKLISKKADTIGLLADRVWHNDSFKNNLFEIIEASKKDEHYATAAANAITILNAARVSFSGMDLSSIRVSGADLSYGIFDHTSFRNSDLRRNNLQDSWLRGTDFTGADLTGVQFRESPFLPHKAEVCDVAYTTDGKRIAVASDNEVILWDFISRERKLILKDHTDLVNSVAFSEDKKMAISGSDDTTVKIWNIESGQCLNTLQGHTDTVKSATFSRDGKLAISGSDDTTVKIWDIKSGHCLNTLRGHTDTVNNVELNQDGRIAISGSDDTTVKIWDIKSGQCLNTLQGHTDMVKSAAFSRDGKLAISGSDDTTVKIWDIKSGQCLNTLQGHTSTVNSVAFSRDNRVAISGSDDTTVKIWDIKSGHCLRTLRHASKLNSIALSEDGKTAVSGSDDGTVKIWNLENEQYSNTFLQGHVAEVISIALSEDGKTAVSGSDDGTIKIWNVENGHCLNTLRGHIDGINSVIISRDGKTIISGGLDKTIKIWKMISGTCVTTLLGHTNIVTSVATNGDGKILLSGSFDKTIKIWKISSSKCIKTLKGHTHFVTSVVLSLDEKKAISGSYDTTIKIWDVNSGQCLKSLEDHTEEISSISLSPDGKTFISGSGDKTIKLWDIENGKCLKTLEGDIASIKSVAFSRDGKMFLSGSDDKTVKLWDLESNKIPYTLSGYLGAVDSIAWHSFNTLVTGSEDYSVKCWKFQRNLNNTPSAILIWSTHGNLYAEGCQLNQTLLALLNSRLLKQKGAIGDPVIPASNSADWNTLHLAVANNKLEQVQQILKEQPLYLDRQTSEGETPLHIAVRYQSIAALKYLIKHGANTLICNKKDQWPGDLAADLGQQDLVVYLPCQDKENIKQTPLHLAIENGYEKVIDYLLQQWKVNKFNLDINAPNHEDQTPLLLASARNNIRIVARLLENGADFNAKNKSGELPIHAAAMHNQVEILKLLKKQGADLLAKDNQGNTSLHFAIISDGVDAIEWLLDQGVPVDITKDDGCTPFHIAAICHEVEILKLLKMKGANLFTKDNLGNTALHKAAANYKRYLLNTNSDKAVIDNLIETVEWLLEQKLPVNLKNNAGETATHIAAYNNQIKILKVLKKHGADFSAKNIIDSTPLHLASVTNQVEVVAWLLEQGMPIDSMRNDGSTPLHLAAYNGSKETVGLLLQKNASTKISNQSGKIPIQLALENNQGEIAKMIEQHTEKEKIRALCKAARINDVKTLQELVQQGTCVNQAFEKGYTALHYACQVGSINAILYLQEHGGNIDQGIPSNLTKTPKSLLSSENLELYETALRQKRKSFPI